MAILIAAGGTIVAQTEAIGDSVATKETSRSVRLGQVVVTGNGHHQLLKSSATPVNVLTKRDIESSGATNLEDILTRLMPQFSSAPNSMGAFLRINGLGNKYILILINGQRVAGDIGGNTDLSRIGTGRIKRIEIIDGAASALYGSDAIGGVINIITEQPTKDTVSAVSDTRISGKGQIREGIDIDIRAKGIGSHTSFAHDEANSFSNNGYEYIDGDDGETQRTLAPLGIGYKSNIISERLTWDSGKRITLHAEMGYSGRRTDRPDSNDSITGGYDYELKSESWRWNLGGVARLGGRNSLLVDLTADKYEYGHEYDINTEDYSIGDYVLSKDQKLYSADIKGIFGLYEGATTVVGINWRRDWLNSVSGNVKEGVNTWAAYASHETDIIRNLKATASLRLTRNENYGTSLTPKLAAMYSKGNLCLRATYSMGYRSPGLDEAYYRYYTYSRSKATITLGSEDLKPEKSNYFSINAEYNSPIVSVSVTGYLNYIKDIITKEAIATDDESIEWLRQIFPEISDEQTMAITKYSEYVNRDKGRVAGIQASVRIRPTDGLDLNISYCYTKARTKEAQGEWTAMERSIRNTVTIGASYIKTWGIYTLGIDLNGRIQSKTYYPDYENAPGFTVWNIRTTHRLKVKGNIIVAPGIGIDNIFNERDTRIDGDNTKYANFSPGRMLVARLRIEL